MMDETGITHMLDRAELCEERGQHHIARHTLNAVFERIEEVEVSNDVFNRAVALDEKLGEAPKEKEEQAQNTKCDKCHGTGNYGRGRQCFACVGKGHQTAEDRVRNKNYWAFRETEAQNRRAKYASQPLF